MATLQQAVAAEQGLSSLEEAAASRADYAAAGKIKVASDKLAPQVAALQAATERVRRAAAARNYAEASRLEAERLSAETAVATQLKALQAEYGTALTPPGQGTSTVTPTGIPAVPAVPTAQAVPSNVPVVATAVVMSGPALDGNREPLMRNAPRGGPIINGMQAPADGVWTTEQYVGGATFCLGILISPLVVFCPCDTREVYVAPNGRRYPTRGNGLRNLLLCIYLISICVTVAWYIIVSVDMEETDDGGGGYTPCVVLYDDCSSSTCCDSYVCKYDNYNHQCEYNYNAISNASNAISNASAQ